MKINRCARALALLLLCAGCARAERPTAETLAAQYRGAAVTAEATVSAFGEYPADYGVSVVCTEGADAEITVTAPDDVAGIRAALSGQTAELSFAGTVLETFLPFLTGYSPLDALPGLVRACARETPVEWGYEERGGVPMVTLTYQDDFPDVTGLRRVWLRESDGALAEAEFYLDDSLVMRLVCTSFSGAGLPAERRAD